MTVSCLSIMEARIHFNGKIKKVYMVSLKLLYVKKRQKRRHTAAYRSLVAVVAFTLGKMRAFLLVAALIASVVVAFVPANVRSPVTRGTIVMDGKSNALKGRIKSIKNTRRITEAMRLVAAARVRRAQDAVLKTRPLIGQLQLVRPPCVPKRYILYSLILSSVLRSFFRSFRYSRRYWMHASRRTWNCPSWRCAT